MISTEPVIANLYTQKPKTYFGQGRTEIASILPEKVTRVLEVGCGTGATMRWIRSQRNIRYALGIEIDVKAAAEAQDTFDMVLSGNVETMDIPNQEFDLIVILDVLEHLVDPWHMIRRLRSVLTPGGSIIASIPNIGHYSVCWSLLRGRWNYADDGLLDRTHLRFFTEATAIHLMSGAGFSVCQIDRNYKHMIWPRWRSKRVNWYTFKILRLIAPDHLMVWQYLIRSIAS